MGTELKQSNDALKAAKSQSEKPGAAAFDLEKQSLRILRCTAKAMASGPGGLRFKVGARPWLDELPAYRSAAACPANQ